MANREKCIVVVCLLAALLLAGCGKQESVPEQIEKRWTLKFWHAMNSEGPSRVIQSAVDRFQHSYPLVTVVVETFDPAEYGEKLDGAMAGGRAPDVFFTRGGHPLLAAAKAGRVANLREALAGKQWKERFAPAALDFCGDENGTWGVPLDVSFLPIWYNTEICKDHRVAIPKTMGELNSACQDLHGEGMTPLALGNKDGKAGGAYFAYLASRQGGAQLFLDAAARKEGAKFDDPAFVRAGEMLQMMVRMQAFPKEFSEADEEQAGARFIKFQSAMYMAGTEFLARVKEEKPALLGKMDCLPFPSVDGGSGDQTAVVGSVDCAFALSAGCKEPGKAIDLLRYLTGPETAADWCALGRIPAMQMEEGALTSQPAPAKKALEILKNAAKIQPRYDQYLSPSLAEEHIKTTRELLALTLTPEDAARRMAECAQQSK